ncbi:universal stress protein [uncultured Shewanella sp.]|uniref:universal stress protein n=1 Tax=uncultured Shewanella sp. TaxID=173975 RepID=UPI002627337D|nr:universal stress protein [uncultured Shewanella sp.]
MRTRQVLCPTDFSKTAENALEYAIELANLYQVDIRLLHVMSSPYGKHNYGIIVETPEELEHHLEAYSLEKMQALLANIENKLEAGLSVKTVIRSGGTAPQILEEAAEHDVGMIVLASHHGASTLHFLHANLAEELVHKAKCPVLVVKDATME